MTPAKFNIQVYISRTALCQSINLEDSPAKHLPAKPNLAFNRLHCFNMVLVETVGIDEIKYTNIQLMLDTDNYVFLYCSFTHY